MPIASRLCPPYPNPLLFGRRNIGAHDIPTHPITGYLRQLDLLDHLNHSGIAAFLHVDLEYFQKRIACNPQKIVTPAVHQGP